MMPTGGIDPSPHRHGAGQRSTPTRQALLQPDPAGLRQPQPIAEAEFEPPPRSPIACLLTLSRFKALGAQMVRFRRGVPCRGDGDAVFKVLADPVRGFRL